VLRRYVQSLIVPAVLDDEFLAAEDGEKWAVPGDVPAASYLQIVQQLPLFPETNVLQMQPQLTGPIRGWNLSRWMLRPFAEFATARQVTDVTGAEIKIDSIFMLLPEKIANPQGQKCDSLCAQCLLAEIERLNAVLRFIGGRLSEAAASVKTGHVNADTMLFVRGQVPHSWKRLSGCHCTNETAKLTSHLIQRHAFLMSWIREGRPKIIDVRALSDVRSFMFGFLADAAIGLQTYDFSVADLSCEIPENAFGLTNVVLVAGAVSEQRLCLGGARPCGPLPLLLCKVAKKVQRKPRLFKCPLYRTAFVNELNVCESDIDLCEGESDNFVWEVGLVTDQPEGDFVATGTALFCQVPDQLA
jgi:hypothetical protein